MIEYMQKYPEEYYRHKDIFGWFRTSQFTKPVSEVLEQQLTLDQHKEQKSDPTWSEHSAAAMRHCVHED
jgi:membrane-bound lytic murein transglycosylase MltF